MNRNLSRTVLAAIVVASALTANAASAAAPDPLTPAQLAGEALFGVLLAADKSQTSQIHARYWDQQLSRQVHETNPLLGRCPAPSRVRNYFLTAAIAHATVTLLLPSESRAAWLAGSIAVEAVVVGRNKRLGLSLHF